MTMSRWFGAAACCALAALPAQAQQPQGAAAYQALPSVTLPPELDRVLRDYERHWRAGDEAALAAIFTDDGFVPTGPGWVRGRESITAAYATSGGTLRLRALAFAVDQTAGYIIGAYRYGEADSGPDNGKFVLALRRSGSGPWQIAADLDQSNRQPR